MKVGILTVHRLPNFGSVLQTYALYQSIRSLGHDCELIDYIYPNKWHVEKGCFHLGKEPLRRRIAQFLGLRPRNFLRLMNDFMSHTMKMSRTYPTFESIHQDPPVYDIYVTGSDQLWNWKTMYMDTTFMLDFVPETKRRISFSTSIAQETIPEEYREVYRRHLSEYQAISVREKNGQKLLKDLFDIDAALIQDPTFLLDAAQWAKLADKAQFRNKIPDSYILCYCLGYTFDPTAKMKELLHRLEKIYNCPVIMLNNAINDYKGTVFRFARNQSIGIPEIIYLFRHATVVATSSFHGTAFSANLGKPFYSLIEKSNQSDDRIPSFLHSIGLTSQSVTLDTDIQEINSCSYNTDKVADALKEIREASLSFLKKNLTDSHEK